MMEDFKQELTTVERQIAAKFEEIKVLKQYRKSIEIAIHLKQKVESKQKAAVTPAGKEEPPTGV